MRKLLGLSLIVAVVIVGYNYFLSVPPASAEESALGELEQRFEAANQTVELANRSAGVSGIDATADIEAARITVRRVETDLQALRERLESDSARRRADLLRDRILEFRKAME